jgi:hypothetical protein
MSDSLSELRQHYYEVVEQRNEALKRIAELERENTELKAKLQNTK